MSFSKCSRSCGGGTKYRMRLCKSANQSTNAVGCSGNDKETVTCNTAPCSGKQYMHVVKQSYLRLLG